jgi:hypothetical protein
MIYGNMDAVCVSENSYIQKHEVREVSLQSSLCTFLMASRIIYYIIRVRSGGKRNWDYVWNVLIKISDVIQWKF